MGMVGVAAAYIFYDRDRRDSASSHGHSGQKRSGDRVIARDRVIEKEQSIHTKIGREWAPTCALA